MRIFLFLSSSVYSRPCTVVVVVVIVVVVVLQYFRLNCFCRGINRDDGSGVDFGFISQVWFLFCKSAYVNIQNVPYLNVS